MAATVGFMVSWIGPTIATLLLLVDHFGPVRETFVSTVMAIVIENKQKTLEVNRIPELETVPM